MSGIFGADHAGQPGDDATKPAPSCPTTSDAAPAPDLVGRDFSAEAPGAKLVGDITYIPTWQGWLYLASVIDCCTKECIGYALADHMRADLVIDALQMAARNHTLADGAIFHSDYAEPCVKPRNRVLACAGGVA